jgi:tRNA A37 threonylcarbamoyladenosine modification protein TsaB
LENILIFDVSSPVVFLGYSNGQEKYFTAKKFEKKQMNSQLPKLLSPLSEKISEILPARIIIGAGPGSFTGIKTGLALFLSLLYTKGIKRVETVSSSRFLRMLYPDIAQYSITAIPFNKGQYFVSCFDSDGASVSEDIFTVNPFVELADIIYLQKLKKPALITPLPENEDIYDFVRTKTEGSSLFCDSPEFRPEIFSRLQGTKTVKFTEEPLFLNYVNLPADISGGTDIYINKSLEVENEDGKDLC